MIWPEANGETLVGLGYSVPYLLPYLDKSDVIAACMPAQQGVIHWPTTGRSNVTLLVDETRLPFATGTVNRILMVHAAENSEKVRQMLHEAHRLLTPSGRLLVIAPNRRGIWSRSPDSPFAQGHPYHSSQLKRLLRETQFTPLHREYMLYLPPTRRRFLLRSANMIEKVGRLFFPGLGGLLMIEAEKQIYAPGKGAVQPVYNTAQAYAGLTNS